MAKKLAHPGAVINRARRGFFAARISTLSSQAAQQAHQLALSMNTRVKLEELDIPADGALVRPGGPPAMPFLGSRSRALSREMERQLALLQKTISQMQAMALREETE